MADARDDSVVVIGLGRFGGALALELADRGTEVLGIDNRAKVVQSFAVSLPHVVTADSTDIETLRQLGVGDFNRAVVGIGSDIEASILTTSMLSELEVADIWAKAISRQHSTILTRVGAHHVISPEHDMGERVAHLLSGRMLDYFEVDEDFAMVKTKPPRDIVGVPLRVTKMRSKYGVTVMAVKSEVQTTTTPPEFAYATPETVLMYGDVILVGGRINDVERFANAR